MTNASYNYTKGKKVISRKYKGKMYVVKVTKKGFKLGKKVFDSLSSVAEAIAGWHNMDGPRFFGLRKAN